jgi:uncharacterized protein
MSKKTQTFMFLSISVLVFLLYVKIDRENKNNMLAAPSASEAGLQGPLENEGQIDRTFEQSVTKSGVLDQAKGKLASIVLNKINVQFKQGMTSSLEWLMKIAEDDTAVSSSNGLVKRTVGNRASGNIKCLPNAAQGEIPGDRVEIVCPVARGKTISMSLEGGDICKRHSSPSTIAKFTIGTYYHFGKGVPQNYSNALNWYRKAANDGFPLANYQLGVLYHNGQGVAQSYKEAFEYFRNAADGDLSVAQYLLGNMYYSGLYVQQNYTEAMKWYRKAAEQGYADAQNDIGVMYDFGYGVLMDEAEAIRWYRKAADRNYASAQYNLGVVYAGFDRPGDKFDEAIKWFRRAADNGHAPSQRSLGIMFQLGLGVKPNNAEAAKWYREAAMQGDPEALAFLGYLYERGLGVRQDTIKANDIYFAAAKYADAEDLFSMGRGWDLDDRHPNDNTMACIWYRLAAHKGNTQGNRNCSKLGKRMTAPQRTHVEEISRQLIEKLDSEEQGEHKGTTNDNNTGEIDGGTTAIHPAVGIRPA